MCREATNREEFDQLLAVFNREIMTGFPDTFGFVGRAGVFGGSRGGRRIDVDLSAESFESLLAAGRTGFYLLMQEMPGAQIQPQPGLELAEPEIRLLPDDRKIAEAGWNRTQLSTAIRAMGDGAFLGEYFDGTRRYNVVLRAENWYSPEELGAIPVATTSGDVMALGELVRVTRTAGPSSIRRVDRKRTLTLQVTPPSQMSMEEALGIIQEKVAPAILASMPEDGTVKYRGTAEALDEALTSMSGSFILAVVILYLLISALFRSFKDSLLVILTDFVEADAAAFADWLNPLRQVNWVVYSKPPFAGPRQVLRYLGRYTHRVAIANRRLIAMDDDSVTFRWKDYRAKGRTKHRVMTLSV